MLDDGGLKLSFGSWISWLLVLTSDSGTVLFKKAPTQPSKRQVHFGDPVRMAIQAPLTKCTFDGRGWCIKILSNQELTCAFSNGFSLDAKDFKGAGLHHGAAWPESLTPNARC